MSVTPNYPYSVDPNNIPPHLSTKQLEFFILFAILVAGKSASQTFKKLDEFLTRNVSWADEFVGLPTPSPSPFEVIRFLLEESTLGVELEASRFGQYSRVAKAFAHVAYRLDPESLSVADLESVPGIGPKTTRFILLYGGFDKKAVPLDTHILKFLRRAGYRAPKSTPPKGERYTELERAFQAEAEIRDLTVRELDTLVWQAYSTKKEDRSNA